MLGGTRVHVHPTTALSYNSKKGTSWSTLNRGGADSRVKGRRCRVSRKRDTGNPGPRRGFGKPGKEGPRGEGAVTGGAGWQSVRGFRPGQVQCLGLEDRWGLYREGRQELADLVQGGGPGGALPGRAAPPPA